ncbi:MAG: hypothetical protein SNJ84_09110 [Verrucomicrobiia bacterium]
MSGGRIEVMGGGLAGLAVAAGLVRRGVPVVVWEGGRTPRHRVCGEFLRGVSPEVWQELGLVPPVQGVKRTVRWWLGERAVATFRLEEAAVAWARPELELRLREMVERGGGEIVEGRRVEPVFGVGRVLATGRRRDPSSPWFAMKCRLYGMDLGADLEMHAGRSGYVGLTRVGDGSVNVSGLFRADPGVRAGTGNPAERLAGLLESAGLRRVAGWVMDAEGWEEGSLSSVAGVRFGWSELPPEVMAVGDARVFIPPLTGKGMAMALEGARLATELVVGFWQGKWSWGDGAGQLDERLRRRFGRAVKVAQVVQAFLMSSRWQPWVGESAARGWLPIRALAGWMS